MQNPLEIGPADLVPYISITLKEMRPVLPLRYRIPWKYGWLTCPIYRYLFKREAAGSLIYMQNSLDIGSADHVPNIITSLKEMRPMQNPLDIEPADLVPYLFERDAAGSLFQIQNYSGLGAADLVLYVVTSLKEMRPVQNPFDIGPADLVPYIVISLKEMRPVLLFGC